MSSADAATGFSIGPARIGPGEPVYVVAEIGVNHNGCARTAAELIHAAAEAGADAVKFQVFAPQRLVRHDAPAAAYQKRAGQGDRQYQMLARLALSPDDLGRLAETADRCDVEFLATPFSVADLRTLLDLGVRAVKLASPDLVNWPLLEAAAASRLPVLASTGAAEMSEVVESVDHFRRARGGPLALLHCVSRYPTPEHEANLAAIRTLGRTFGCVTGFSDHTESTAIGGYAAAAGAAIIEKHFTLSRAQDGPDHAFSLEPAAMAEYIRGIRAAEVMLGNGRITVSPGQEEVRRLARGSVVAACDIPAGRRLSADMLTVKRPGDGISPRQISALIGRVAARDIPADAPIAWESLK